MNCISKNEPNASFLQLLKPVLGSFIILLVLSVCSTFFLRIFSSYLLEVVVALRVVRFLLVEVEAAVLASSLLPLFFSRRASMF